MRPQTPTSRHDRANERAGARLRPTALVAAALAIAASCAGRAFADQSFPQITPAEVVAWQEKGESFLFIDTRLPQVYGLKHAAGAINIPSFAVTTTPLPKDARIVLYDAGAGSIEHVKGAQALRAKGYASFWVMKGGLTAWEAQGYRIVAPPGESPIPFVETIAVDDLVRLQENGMKVAVVDVRPRASFMQGHVPGAVSASAGPDVARSVASLTTTDLIVLYDDGTGDAKDRAEELRRKGYRSVKVLYGGMLGWREKKLKVDR